MKKNRKSTTKKLRLLSLILAALFVIGCTPANKPNITAEPDKTNAPENSDENDQANSDSKNTGISLAIPVGTGVVIPEGIVDDLYIESTNAFAAAMLNQLDDSFTGVISPLSIQLAMELLANGADSELQMDMLSSLLGASEIAEVNLNAAKLIRSIITAPNNASKDEYTTIFNIANAIIADVGDEFLQEFENVAGDYYNSYIGSLDFSDSVNALNEINSWINEHTYGLVENMLDELPAETAFAIINTIYFKAKWQKDFIAFKMDSTFHGLNGDTQVTMLQSKEKYNYGSFTCGEMVLLPYGNGEYYMSVVLPKDGITPKAALSELIGRWDECKETDCSVIIPSVDLNTNIDVRPILSNMGFENIVNGNAALSGILSSPVFVNQIEHGVRLKVTEEGTEAGAGTVISGPKSGEILQALEFRCDRPYAMAIVHAETGAVVFVSTVNDIG